MGMHEELVHTQASSYSCFESVLGSVSIDAFLSSFMEGEGSLSMVRDCGGVNGSFGEDEGCE